MNENTTPEMIQVTVAGELVREYRRLDAAKAKADAIASEQGVEVEVAQGGTVVYLTSPRAQAKREQGVHYVPWSRLHDLQFAAPDLEGFYPAYQRVRVQATVYRAYDNEAEMPWLVFDGREGCGGMKLARTTKEACGITSAMRHGLRLVREA